MDRGFVTYSNAAKVEMLGVPAELIAAVGAVSQEVAERMAEGAVGRSAADIAVAVTGVAGPGGGTAEKPVGLVWFRPRPARQRVADRAPRLSRRPPSRAPRDRRTGLGAYRGEHGELG